MNVFNVLNRVLKAVFCPITDEGIKALCAGVDGCEGGVNRSRLGRCKQIRTLDIRGTAVTKKGVQMILENLQHLNKFKSDCQIQVMADLLRGPLQHRVPQCVSNLTSLGNSSLRGRRFDFGCNVVCQRGDIQLVAKACCSVNKANIDTSYLNCDNRNDTVMEILQLKTVSTFTIEGGFEENSTLTFDGGIVPVLRKFSSTLTSLTFKFLNSPLNILTIVEHCPKLEKLKIEHCMLNDDMHSEEETAASTCKRVKTDWVLENLKTLKVSYCEDLSAEHFSVLLLSPKLNNLWCECNSLQMDDYFCRASSVHQCQNLQTLFFRLESGITKRGIDCLMNERNCLEEIFLFSCKSIEDSDVLNWSRLAREKNWDAVFLYD